MRSRSGLQSWLARHDEYIQKNQEPGSVIKDINDRRQVELGQRASEKRPFTKPEFVKDFIYQHPEVYAFAEHYSTSRPKKEDKGLLVQDLSRLRSTAQTYLALHKRDYPSIFPERMSVTKLVKAVITAHSNGEI